MNEPSFASLTPSLLARKGSARPAMRPQHGGMLGNTVPATQLAAQDERLDDLGWNDMGQDGDKPSRSNAEVVQMSPAPSDNQAGADSAEARPAAPAFSSSPARDQQKVLARRLEKKSPPVLAEAIMAEENQSAEPERNSDEATPERPVAATAPAASPRIAVKKFAAAADQGKRAAFTLRMDADRHLKLRLASTIHGRSAQQIVTQALDAYLGEMPELDALAAQVKRS